MKLLKHIAVAAALLMFLSTAALADIIPVSITQPGLLVNPEAEATWIKDTLGLSFVPSFLAKIGEDSEREGSLQSYFTVDFSGTSATISWDLTGTGAETWYVLVKYANDYALYTVTAAQLVIGGGSIGPFSQGVSHVSFFGRTAVPEPTTLLLLGAGLLGVGILSRKLR